MDPMFSWTRRTIVTIALLLMLAAPARLAEYNAPCISTTDCWATYNEHYVCEAGSCSRPAFSFGAKELLGLFLVMLVSGVTSAAGIGGGVLLMPVVMYCFDFSASDAIPVSRVSVLAGSAATFLMMFPARHPGSGRLQIDFELASLINPLTVAGIEVGVLLAKVLPVGCVMVGFVVMMAYISYKTYLAGSREHAREAQSPPQGAYQELQTQGSSTTPAEPESLWAAYQAQSWNLSVIALSVGVSAAGSLLRGGPGRPSLVGLLPCSKNGLLILVGSQLFNLVLPVVIWKHRDARASFQSPHSVKLRGHFGTAVLLCYMMGVAGGLFGGASFFVVATLLEIGVDPETVTATIGNSAFWATLVIVTQFAAMGGIQLRHAVSLALAGLLGAGFGVSGLLWVVKRYNKPSILIWVIFLLLAVSLVVVPFDTVYRTLNSPREYFSFSSYC